MPLTTELTRSLGLRAPVIAAPLGRGSTPEFLSAVSNAGGLGFVALMHMPEAEVSASLADYIGQVGSGDRFGVNLTLIVDQHARLDAALDVGCRIVSLWQGDIEAYARKAKDAGAKVFWTVSGREDAARAADLGVDFIVSQGREAGGHIVGETSQMAQLPQIVDASRDVPVIAAGGIATGRGLAAALALGAEGVWMGTRFVATHECGNHPGYKKRITQASSDLVVETELFDGGWPNSPHRVIRNSTYDAWQNAGRPPIGSRPGEDDVIGETAEGDAMKRYNVSTPWAEMKGDWEAGPHYAGASTGLIDQIQTVEDVLRTVVEEAETAIDALASRSIQTPGRQ